MRRSVLPGGLRIVTEQVPGVRSATFGIWVGIGSRDETPKQAGASHFLEHLLFKGTRRRDALEIASVMDAVGGEMNAFTAKEYTCFYARVLDRDLPMAVDVISDMVTSSVITQPDVESERGVILDEIAMHEDDPGDVVHDVFAEAAWGDHPLGRPVIGTVDTIEAITKASIKGYYERRYAAPAMVVAAAGALDHAAVVKLVRRAFGGPGLLDDPSASPDPVRAGGRGPAWVGGVRVAEQPTEQANFVLGTPGLSRHDDRRFALSVLNAALGGGMSSRLFQEIRERRGLAYSVYSHTSSYADTGLFGVSAGCAPAKLGEVLRLCRDELDAVASSGITDEERRRAQGQLVGSLVLGLEDTGSRMSRIGKGELVHGDVLPVEDVIARIETVTLDEVREVAAEVLGDGRWALGVVGPESDVDYADAVA